jgi:hypothetical protein
LFVCWVPIFTGSALQRRDIGMHSGEGQNLVPTHSRVSWSPV